MDEITHNLCTECYYSATLSIPPDPNYALCFAAGAPRLQREEDVVCFRIYHVTLTRVSLRRISTNSSVDGLGARHISKTDRPRQLDTFACKHTITQRC